MTESQVLKVQLEPPVAGWGLLRVRKGDSVVERSFSYTPEDTITQLVEAVDAVVAHACERSVVFRSEPEELDVLLRRETPGSGVLLALVQYPDRNRGGGGGGVELLSVRLSPELVGKLFWRALRGLESAMPGSDYEQAWHHPFPARLVAQLGDRLR